MKSYKGVRYTSKKWPDGRYTWHTRYKNGDEIMTGGDSYLSKDIAESKCREHIDNMARLVSPKQPATP